MNTPGKPLTEIDLTEVSAIIDRLEKSRFNYLDLQIGGLRITLGESARPSEPTQGGPDARSQRRDPVRADLPRPAQPVVTEDSRPPAAADDHAGDDRARADPFARDAADARADAVAIRAPMVGRYYAQPEPGAAPFVRVGERVEVGATIALIEVMKVFNAVSADVAGEILELPIGDGEFVEFDQPLAWVRAE
ncbi:MAG: biotin/lipoyl-containing protein [Burkholderiaceae bacterium]